MNESEYRESVGTDMNGSDERVSMNENDRAYTRGREPLSDVASCFTPFHLVSNNGR